MPQLSPLNWLMSFFLIIIFSLALASIFWWRQNLIFPTLQKNSSMKTLSSPWPW